MPCTQCSGFESVSGAVEASTAHNSVGRRPHCWIGRDFYSGVDDGAHAGALPAQCQGGGLHQDRRAWRAGYAGRRSSGCQPRSAVSGGVSRIFLVSGLTLGSVGEEAGGSL